MSTSSYFFGILVALVTLGVVIEMLRRRRLRERHAMWWVVAGTLALVISVFPGTLIWAADIFGVGIPSNLVFFVSITVLVLVCIQHSAELTDLESKTRTLVEMSALQDLRLRELEARLADVTPKTSATTQVVIAPEPPTLPAAVTPTSISVPSAPSPTPGMLRAPQKEATIQ